LIGLDRINNHFDIVNKVGLHIGVQIVLC